MPAKKPWPPETIARLRAAWESGVSATRIGAELGFTKNAIIGKARREGLSPRDARFAADLAVKVETEQDRETIRRLWPTHSITHIKAFTGIGWRRILRIADSLGLPSKATVIIDRNRASPPRGAGVSGAQIRTSRSKRAARTSAAPPSARGGWASFPPPASDLPGVAPDTLQQRRVFLGTQCKAVIGGERRAVRFCDQPVIASAKGQHCASPYCLEHYAAAYIGTNKDLGEPNKLRWRA
jgi:hypothetical protein